MSRILSLSLFIILSVSTAVAGNVTVGQAQSEAIAFFRQKGLLADKSASSGIRRAYGPSTGTADYYVFNNGANNGFVIIAGDDRAHTILGYSLKGHFDYAEAPAQVRSWLDGYGREIRWLRTNDYVPSVRREAKYKPVSPLLCDISWDQTYPYNLMTPCYVGTTHSATGCVATAMAQIMYYHKYPAQGAGQKTYKPETLNQTITVDFSKSHYGWDVMTPKYDATSTDTARNAVALLMRDCGVAVEMAYGEQSGSMIDRWPVPLTTNFGYDKGLGYLTRTYYSQTEWDDIIRSEIDNARPVFATGFTDGNGGHAFVFDGYDADGLIHVNWGWSGMSNGYFRTSALTPPSQGTGGSSGGFNYRQGIIVGIQPPTDNSEDWLQVVSSERTKVSAMATAKTVAETITLGGKVANYGWKDVTVDLGFGIYDSTGTLRQTIVAKSGQPLAKDKFIIGVKASAVDLSQLPSGDYALRPIARNAGGSKWFHVCNYNYTKTNVVRLSVTADSLFFHQAESYDLKADTVTTTKIYRGVTSRATATVHNDGELEYSGPLRTALFNADGTLVAQSGDFNYDIPAGDSVAVAISNAFTVSTGTYYFGILDENTQKVSGLQRVVVLDTPADEAVITMARQLSFANNNNVPADSVTLTAHLKVDKGVFANDLSVYIYDADGKNVMGSFDPVFLFAEAGETPDVTFTCPFENGVVGQTYKAVLVNLSQLTYITPKDLASCTFTLSAPTADGITDTMVSPVHRGLVYSLDGRIVGHDCTLHGLAPGLYIINGKKYIVK